MIRERFGRERFNGAFAELTNIVPTFGFYNLRKGFCQYNLLLNHAYNAETDRYLFRFLNQGGLALMEHLHATKDVRHLRALEVGVAHVDVGCNGEAMPPFWRANHQDRMIHSCCVLHASDFGQVCEERKNKEPRPLSVCRSGPGEPVSELNMTMLDYILEHARRKGLSNKGCRMIFEKLNLASTDVPGSFVC